MVDKQVYVVVFPDGTEFWDTVRSGELDGLVRGAVRGSGLKTSRSDPQTIRLEIFEVTFVEGKPVRKLVASREAELPRLPMTSEEYGEAITALLKVLPQEFHGYVGYQTYERAHASGYEEMLAVAADIINGLQPSVAKYGDALQEQQRAGAEPPVPLKSWETLVVGPLAINARRTARSRFSGSYDLTRTHMSEDQMVSVQTSVVRENNRLELLCGMLRTRLTSDCQLAACGQVIIKFEGGVCVTVDKG